MSEEREHELTAECWCGPTVEHVDARGAAVMDERRDLVDREELRRRINEDPFPVPEVWEMHLDAMPAVECPRGWTRDEVLAELDADPDAVCEWQSPDVNDWFPVVSRRRIGQWHPEVRRYDVRVVRVAPEPEWVPLTQLVGRTIVGEAEPVLAPPLWTVVGDRAEWRWLPSCSNWTPFPEGTLNMETGQVAVRPKAAT